MTLQDDLGQDHSGQILVGLAVSDPDIAATENDLLDIPERHVGFATAIVQSAIGVSSDVDCLAHDSFRRGRLRESLDACVFAAGNAAFAMNISIIVAECPISRVKIYL
jgi:hypothetical protein